jgi:hypothetical protein
MRCNKDYLQLFGKHRLSSRGTSAMGPGCVKTRPLADSAESFSQTSSSAVAARSLRIPEMQFGRIVFSTFCPRATFHTAWVSRYRNGRPRYVRLSLDSDRVADIAGGPVRARDRRAQAQVNSYLFGDRSQLSGARDRMFYLSAICPPSFGSVRATLPNTAPSQHTPKVRSAFAWRRRERRPTTPAPLCFSRQGRARAMSYRDLGD